MRKIITKSTPKPQPHRVLRVPALILAGLNKTYQIGPNPEIKEQWSSFMGDFGRIETQVGYNAYGVCHAYDGKGQMDYLCAAEVKDPDGLPNYFHVLRIPARKIAIFIHDGPLHGLTKTWSRIFSEWLPAAKLQVALGPQFEVYGEEFNRGKEKIEVHIPVK